MSGLVTFLVEHAGDLVLAFTVLLGLGSLAVAASRSTHARHRLAELSFAASLVAIALLVLPLPRPAAAWLGTQTRARDHGSSTLEAAALGTPAFDPSAPETTTSQGRPDAAQPLAREVAYGPWFPLDEFDASPPTRGDRTSALPVTRPSRETRPGASLPSSRVLAGLFLAGALGFALHLALAVALVRRTLRTARSAPAWINDLAPGSDARAATVLVSTRAARPFCCGLLRGTVVLPASLARPELCARVEAVLHHERAHLAQNHPRARFLAALGAPFLYWNPLYWWLVRELRRTAELLADDMAAARHGKRRYVAELLELATQTRQALVPQAARLDVLGPRKDFQKRMETLLMRQSRLATRSSGSHVLARSACTLVVLGSVSLAWGHAPAQDAVQDPVVEDFLVKQKVDPLVSDFFVGAGKNQDGQDRPDARDPNDARDAVDTDAFFVGANSQDAEENPFLERTQTVDRADPLQVAGDPVPSVELLFEADGPHALGAFLIHCAGEDFSIGKLQLESPRRGKHRGQVTLSGMTPEGLQGFMSREPAGLKIIYARFENATVTVPGSQPSPPRDEASAALARISAQLDALTRRLDQLEGRRANPFADDLIGTGDGSGGAAPALQATVTEVTRSNGQTLVVLDRGHLRGVTKGDKFEIYSGSSYKGRVRIIDTSKEYSVATIESQAKPIVAGDKATTRL